MLLDSSPLHYSSSDPSDSLSDVFMEPLLDQEISASLEQPTQFNFEYSDHNYR